MGEIIRISIIKKMAQYQDERGFTKTEMEVWNPNQEGANFQATVNLVERNPNPDGFQLANPAESGKVDQFALVELAGAIQQADKFTRATAGSKLSNCRTSEISSRASQKNLRRGPERQRN